MDDEGHPNTIAGPLERLRCVFLRGGPATVPGDLQLRRPVLRRARRDLRRTLYLGQIVHFDNVRAPWDRGVLRASGLPDPLKWRVLARPLDGWIGRGVRAQPHFVAVTDTDVRVVSLYAGIAPERLSQEALICGALELAVVIRKCTMAERTRLGVWRAYDDGGDIEALLTRTDVEAAWDVACRYMRQWNRLAATCGSLAGELAERGLLLNGLRC